MSKPGRPSISIVTPNYNCASFVGQTIESVLSQRYANLEYVVIDGASTDGSQAIIEQYRDRLSAYVSEPDRGHADAINKGFALTSGEIMGWINSDDILLPGCLETVAQVFEAHPEIEWITGRPTSISEAGSIYSVQSARHWSRLRFLAGDFQHIQQESTFWRRKLWEKSGAALDTTLDMANDLELWVRYFRHADLYTVDALLGCFRRRTGQRSAAQAQQYSDEAIRVLAHEFDGLPLEFKRTHARVLGDHFHPLSALEIDEIDPLLAVYDTELVRSPTGEGFSCPATAPPTHSHPKADFRFNGTNGRAIEGAPNFQTTPIYRFEATLIFDWDRGLVADSRSFSSTYPAMPAVFGAIRIMQHSTRRYEVRVILDEGELSSFFAVRLPHHTCATIVVAQDSSGVTIAVNGRLFADAPGRRIGQAPGVALLGCGFESRTWIGAVSHIAAELGVDGHRQRYTVDFGTPDGTSFRLRRKSAPYPADDLSRFRGVHAGKRCFVMGNGPSLNKMDLAKLENEIVFGCNSIFLLFDRISWRPRYYTCVDSRVLPDRRAEIDEMLRANPDIVAFFPADCQIHTGERQVLDARDIVAPGKNRFFFREKFNTLEDPPRTMFSLDANDHLVMPYTVAITMLQLAAYMGFDEIYLIGCDTSYSIPKSVIGESKSERFADGLALTSTEDDDPNHFDPSYFGKGRQWHNPQTQKMIEHYRWAKQALDGANIRVYNATVGGALEVFPRRDFDSLFTPPRAMRTTLAAEARRQSAAGRLPKTLLIDFTPIGGATATGELKATYFEPWDSGNLLHLHCRSGQCALSAPGGRYRVASDELILAAVRAFAPDIILYRPVAEHPRLHNLTMEIVRETTCPLAIWIMDDWPERLRRRHPNSYAQLDGDLRWLLARSSLNLAISEKMALAFSERYGVAFEVCRNGVRPEEWAAKSETIKRGFVVRYAGGLAPDMTRDSVRDVAEVVSKLSREVPIRLEINTHKHWIDLGAADFEGLPGVSVQAASMEPEAYRTWLQQADLILFAYNFDEDSVAYVRYSFANKLPECLAAGAAVLAYGPSSAGSIEYLRDNELAEVLDERSKEQLENRIRALYADPLRMQKLGARAREHAFQKFDLEKAARAFERKLTAAARSPRPTESDAAKFDQAPLHVIGPLADSAAFSSFAGGDTLCLNEGYLRFEKAGLSPKLYACLDPTGGVLGPAGLRRLAELPNGPRMLLSDAMYRLLWGVDGPAHVDNVQWLLDAASLTKVQPITTAAHAILWAMLLGRRNIVTIGLPPRSAEHERVWGEVMDIARAKGVKVRGATPPTMAPRAM